MTQDKTGRGPLSAMTGIWTQEQDDQAAFDEAMEVADVSLRVLHARLCKMRSRLEKIHEVRPKVKDTLAAHVVNMIDDLQGTLQTPPVAQWRQRHSEGRGKRHSQQHVLEVKLAFALQLLEKHGVDFDQELAKRRLGS